MGMSVKTFNKAELMAPLQGYIKEFKNIVDYRHHFSIITLSVLKKSHMITLIL